MDHYELGVALAVSRVGDLRRQADRWRLASRSPSRTAGRSGNRAPGAMPVQHGHEPGLFDPGHCRSCARQAGLLDHYRQVQQQEASLRQAHTWAVAASRRASVALWSAGAAILLAVVALLRG